MIKTQLAMSVGGSGIWTGDTVQIGSSSKNLSQLIKSIFATGEQGFAYDPNDLTTLYQDAAGTIPVTAQGQPVGLMLDKSKGLALGSTTVTNGNFESDTAWNKGAGWSISNGKARFDGTGSYSNLGGVVPTSINGKFFKVEFELSDVGTSVTQVRILTSGGLAATVPVIGAGKYSAFVVGSTVNSVGIQTQAATGANYAFSLDNVSLKELAGSHAYQTVSASRPILQRNATTGAYYLAFDGADDFLETNNIDFTATDKVSLFAGVRKLSDVNTGIIAELSTRAGTSLGAFVLYAPFDPVNKGYGFRSVGILEATTYGALPLSPTSNVLAAKASIEQDTVTMRVDSLQYGVLTQDQGTRNYGNYPLYIGRRGGTILPFNGHLYSLIGIGRLTTDSETITLEKAIAKNTGVTL